MGSCSSKSKDGVKEPKKTSKNQKNDPNKEQSGSIGSSQHLAKSQQKDANQNNGKQSSNLNNLLLDPTSEDPQANQGGRMQESRLLDHNNNMKNSAQNQPNGNIQQNPNQQKSQNKSQASQQNPKMGTKNAQNHHDPHDEAMTKFASGMSLSYEKQFDQALALFMSAIEMWQKLPRWDANPDLAIAQREVATLYEKQQRIDDAIPHAEEALRIFINSHNQQAEVGKTYNALGILYAKKNMPDQAKDYFLNSLGIAISQKGGQSQEVAILYDNIGQMSYDLDKLDDALDNFSRSLELRQMDPNASKTIEVGRLTDKIGSVYRKQGIFDQAMRMHTTALSFFENNFPDKYDELSVIHQNIGYVYEGQHAFQAALDHHLKSLEFAEKTHGKDHVEIAICYINIGGTLSKDGEYDKAIERYKQAIEIYERWHGKESIKVADCYDNISDALILKKQYDEALEFQNKKLAIYEKEYGKDSLQLRPLMQHMATIYSNKGSYPEAFDILEKALQLTRNKAPNDHHSEIEITSTMGKIHVDSKNFEEAMNCYLKALELSESKNGANHPTNAFLYDELASVYESTNQVDNAVSALNRSLRLTKKSKTPNSLMAKLHQKLGDIYYGKQEFKKAKEHYANCLDMRVHKFGLKDEETKAIYLKAYEMCERNGIEKSGIDDYTGDFGQGQENNMGTDEGIRNPINSSSPIKKEMAHAY